MVNVKYKQVMHSSTNTHTLPLSLSLAHPLSSQNLCWMHGCIVSFKIIPLAFDIGTVVPN